LQPERQAAGHQRQRGADRNPRRRQRPAPPSTAPSGIRCGSAPNAAASSSVGASRNCASAASAGATRVRGTSEIATEIFPPARSRRRTAQAKKTSSAANGVKRSIS
jgi:hypothetical protein